jgi:hypothetical protein
MSWKQSARLVRTPWLTCGTAWLTLTSTGCVLKWERQSDAGLGPPRRDAAMTEVMPTRPSAVEAGITAVSDSGEPSLDAAPGLEPPTQQPEVDADASLGPAQSVCTPACGEAETCESATLRCNCQSGYRREQERCVPDPCAATVCAMNERCTPVAGQAECSCVPGATDCGEAGCVDLQRDAAHCGRCDLACVDGARCVQGSCDPGVHELILSHDNSCALLQPQAEAYTLKCWGDPRFDFFRDGTSAAVALPREISGIPAARKLTFSQHHRCALGADADTLNCWGRCFDECGLRLGWPDDYEDAELTPSTTPSGALVSLVSPSTAPNRAATCELRASGQVECRGWSALTTGIFDEGRTTTILLAGASARFRDLAGAYDHLCGSLRDEQARVACWGLNDFQQLGAPRPTSNAVVYVQREEGGDLVGVQSVSVGQYKACAVLQSGAVYCWGDNSTGALGHGDLAPHVGAVEVLGVANAVQVAVASAHACARTASGDVYCWGRAAYVGLGAVQGDAGEGAYFTSAQRVTSLRGVLDLRAAGGGNHSCARLETGALMCWGSNASGQLGDGTTLDRQEPTPISGLR